MSVTWDLVVLTAGSEQQAEAFRAEVHRRRESGLCPAALRVLVVADPPHVRIGSGGATLRALAACSPSDARVLILHAGGSGRRLPEDALTGRLFAPLPNNGTVFDDLLVESAAWLPTLPPGVLVASGDVLLHFDPPPVFPPEGVHGVALPVAPALAAEHGAYVLGEAARVYGYLQKPSLDALRAAGGLSAGPQGEEFAAIDTGLLFFSPLVAASLRAVAAGIDWSHAPALDLYAQLTRLLTAQWAPGPTDPAALHHLAGVLRGVPFTASVAQGTFHHVPGSASPGAGVIDSVLGASSLGPGAAAIECLLPAGLRLQRGSVARGLHGLDAEVEIPEDTYVHQVAVRRPGAATAHAILVRAVADSPAAPLWFGRPIEERAAQLGLPLDQIWDSAERTLGAARLFPLGAPQEAWAAASWLLGSDSEYDLARWLAAPRVSLESAALCIDETETLAARVRRGQARWTATAVALAQDGADVRPMLDQAPGPNALRAVGDQLSSVALRAEASAEWPTAASRLFQAGLFYSRVDAAAARGARARSFELVAEAVRLGVQSSARPAPLAGPWPRQAVRVSASGRIDLGGGWSDTPPFCLDWGGTVLNAALLLDNERSIEARLRVIPEPLIRCRAEGSEAAYQTSAELWAPPGPGDRFAIARTVCQMSGLFPQHCDLTTTLQRLGGGLEFETAVRLPMGSGLGTSSILAAAVLQAFEALRGARLDPQPLSDRVLELEQRMSTGGGWQDQAGGIFPGLKLLSSGPGLVQRVRSRQILLTPARQAELESLLVIGWTGITRVAKGLLQEVVGRYLARETRAVEVLHSIKTLALEMAHAIENAEWDYLGQLLDRHWALNQVLDPNTTNAPIEEMLRAMRPYLRGAKLAGAGGGGFLLLLARDEASANHLRRLLNERFPGSRAYPWRLDAAGLCVEEA